MHVLPVHSLLFIPFTGENVLVPDALMQELADLQSAHALLLRHFERALQTRSKAQEEFIAFLRQQLPGAVPLDCNIHLAFEILKKEEEISLFSVQYLKNVSIILPGEVR